MFPVGHELPRLHRGQISDICTVNEIKLYYKLINKQLSQYFNSFTCEANYDIHGYNTRSPAEMFVDARDRETWKVMIAYACNRHGNWRRRRRRRRRSRNKIHIPKTNDNFAQNNLRYRIIQTLNKLPDNVIRKMYTHSIYGLTSYAKKYFISNYKTDLPSKTVTQSMLNAVIISDMSIIIFIIKHPHHSGRNVMLDLCLTVLMGEPGRLCRLVRFSRQHICCRAYWRGRGRVGWIFQCNCWSASSYY